MIQFTTPTHNHVVKNIDLTGCKVWVTYSQHRTTLDVLSDDVTYDGTDTTVSVSLTQTQTGMFKSGKVDIQINWIYPDDTRDAVIIKSYDMDENLMPRVMPYAGD